MTRALHRALRWVADASEAEIAQALAPLFPHVAPALIGAAIVRYRALGLYAADPVIVSNGVAWLKAAMLGAGTITREVTFEAVVDTSIAREAAGTQVMMLRRNPSASNDMPHQARPAGGF